MEINSGEIGLMQERLFAGCTMAAAHTALPWWLRVCVVKMIHIDRSCLHWQCPACLGNSGHDNVQTEREREREH